jgi:hypothetical protein
VQLQTSMGNINLELVGNELCFLSLISLCLRFYDVALCFYLGSLYL